MNFKELEAQLPNKKKSVKELVDIISLRTDDLPNYSVLLGAGASITSDIRSATTLIKEWRNEFCSNITDPEEQKIYLRQNFPDWYETNREYSSLFEKKFDLQRQRRMFVEKEVAGKSPSIGYAYLTSLVDSNYFHTLFTTNFDDLINEAFYLYSPQRPIVCAHDSSINSVTVTSRRPKIVKLHGDYLFDDIKATARETESLEQNMKAKFTEFAKDFGLIVVGYSGCDRSIMDVLSLLIKNDSYFKNGIYWCLRSDSEVSEELKKLLWKDKVYFVEIDGFDELFAELHSNFNEDESIPISTSSVSRRPNEIINKLLSSEYFSNSKSKILQKAYSQLLRESKQNTLMNLIMRPEKGEAITETQDFTNDEMITRIELQNSMNSGKFREVIDQAKTVLLTTSKESLRNILHNFIISAHRALGEIREAIMATDELISSHPFAPGNYLRKADICLKKNEALACINQAIEVSPNWYRGYLRKARLLLSQASMEYGDLQAILVADAAKAVDMSLEKDPSLDNSAWTIKFEIINKYEKDKATQDRQMIDLMSKMENMNSNSPSLLSLKMERLTSKEKKQVIDLIDEVKLLKMKTPSYGLSKLDSIILKGLLKVDDTDYINATIKEIELAHSTQADADLTIGLANVKIKKLAKDQEAISMLQASLAYEFDVDVLELLIESHVDLNHIKDAEALLNRYSHRLIPEVIHNLKMNILDRKKDYEGAIIEVKKWCATIGRDDAKGQLYYLIKNENYSEAERIGRGLLEKINFAADATIEIVNYELACKKLRQKFSTHRLENLIKFDTTNKTKTAVYALLGKKPEMMENIKKELKEDNSFRFLMERWPVFDEYRNDTDFQKVMEIGTKEPLLQIVANSQNA